MSKRAQAQDEEVVREKRTLLDRIDHLVENDERLARRVNELERKPNRPQQGRLTKNEIPSSISLRNAV